MADAHSTATVAASCTHCGAAFRKPLANPPRTVHFCSDACRFWSKVDKSGGPAECWPFIGASVNGYGSFRLNGKSRRAHRIAWALTNGPIPARLFVCHRCDNRQCCNPSHFFLGTALDNVRDMRSKGRSEVSQEARTRMSIDRRGKPLPQHVLEAAWAGSTGRKQSPEEIARRAEANRGQKRSEETKARLRAAWVRRREQKGRP